MQPVLPGVQEPSFYVELKPLSGNVFRVFDAIEKSLSSDEIGPDSVRPAPGAIMLSSREITGSFKFEDYSMTPESKQLVLRALRINISINWVNLSNHWTIPVESLARLVAAGASNRIQTLDLSEMELDAEKLFTITDALRRENDEPIHPMTQFILAGNRFGEHPEAIPRLFAAHPTLTLLNLNKVTLSAVSVDALAGCLRTNTTLEILLLGDCKINDGVEGQHLVDSIGMHPSLQTVDLWENLLGDNVMTKLGEALKTTTTITLLSLQRNHIGALGIEALASGLKENDSLTMMNVMGRSNTYGCEDLRHFDIALNFNLSLRHLYQNYYEYQLNERDEGLKSLGKKLKRNQDNDRKRSLSLFESLVEVAKLTDFFDDMSLSFLVHGVRWLDRSEDTSYPPKYEKYISPRIPLK